MKDIDGIIAAVQEVAAEEQVSFTLRKRPDSPNWYLRIFGGNKREKSLSLGTTDKRIAKGIEAEVRSRLNKTDTEGVVPYSTERFFQVWLKTKSGEVSVGTINRYRAALDKSLPFMAEHVHLVKTSHVERYRDWMVGEGYKPRSIILELNVLVEVFSKAVRLGYGRVNPAESVKKPKKPLPDVEPYTEEEVEVILLEFERRSREGSREQSLDAWNTYAEVLHCLNFTGMRVGDALSLKWKNVNLKFSTIKLKQIKTGRDVFIRIPTAYKNRLEKLADASDGLSGYVFVNTAGNNITYTRIDHAIRKVLKSLGMQKKSPLHSFRHTVCMRLLDAGIPVHEVAAQLGDSVETIVRNYVKQRTPTQEAVDSAFGGVYRNCTEHIKDFSVQEENRKVVGDSVSAEKSQKTKDFLSGHSRSQVVKTLNVLD